ncbi:hypothetical protein Xcel_1952 [Xylanimonas cellulosilytica DSM 15894]|uniref:Uncharacterized protein n=1 Tax=Xylanimonas cellulosilytica (strain DSM 15894 / JCM 12276 / CECT 5975 / KCTC 9989 / LMG 20990 / NBRC 107835 / XIL07) TaxID=446471 RepID=D1BTJ2_XYLCX|nr:hypothetical protein [Xylanimonas cellulosilytica]ACZ30971.1 hypothetical protein Xcel_1952 [Xylanimonas cellulosilytica DSM 15894]
MSAVLTVPAPAVELTDAGGGVAALERPVTVRLGAVTLDGVPSTPPDLDVFGFAVQRRTAPGTPAQVWDDAAKAWVPDVAGQTFTPGQLAYEAGSPQPWSGILVAAGATDSTGAPAFASATAGYPHYTFRGAFAGKDGALVSGPPSPPVTFVSAAESGLLVLGPDDGEKAEDATLLRALLKDASRQVIGGLRVLRDAPGAQVRLENAAGAAVVLLPDGGIELRPAPGRRVVVAGDLETGRITYEPAGGGVKVTLP